MVFFECIAHNTFAHSKSAHSEHDTVRLASYSVLLNVSNINEYFMVSGFMDDNITTRLHIVEFSKDSVVTIAIEPMANDVKMTHYNFKKREVYEVGYLHGYKHVLTDTTPLSLEDWSNDVKITTSDSTTRELLFRGDTLSVSVLDIEPNLPLRLLFFPELNVLPTSFVRGWKQYTLDTLKKVPKHEAELFVRSFEHPEYQVLTKSEIDSLYPVSEKLKQDWQDIMDSAKERNKH